MIVSAGRKIFENLKLENYRSDINKKVRVEVNQKQRGIFRGDQERKNHMEFPGVLVLGLKSSEGGVTQFCGVSSGEALFFLNFHG